jgi:hypothetical protein
MRDIKLTELQTAFIDALFGEAEGNIVKAAQIAGYNSPSHNAHRVAATLRDEILERAKLQLVFVAHQAVFALSKILNDPLVPGAKERMAAIIQILDRIGVVKTDKVEVNAKGGIFVLPAKRTDDDADG